MVFFPIVKFVFRGPILRDISRCQASNSSSLKARLPGMMNLTVAPFSMMSISTPCLTEYNDDQESLRHAIHAVEIKKLFAFWSRHQKF